MPLKRTLFVPQFDSQLPPNITCSLVSLDEPGRDHIPKPTRRVPKRPAKNKTTGLVLTVKLPKRNQSTPKKSKTMARRCDLEPAFTPVKKTTSQREKKSCGSGSDSVKEKDVYNFSQEKHPKSEKDKVRMTVLRNISRMLAENNLIRQRLVSLTQVNLSNT